MHTQRQLAVFLLDVRVGGVEVEVQYIIRTTEIWLSYDVRGSTDTLIDTLQLEGFEYPINLNGHTSGQ
jgi:hypothetical protein